MFVTRIVSRLLLCVVLFIAPVAILPGGAIFASPGPEGVEWRLIEVGGTAVPPLSGNEQPSLTLDGAQKKVTGYSGCNKFFGTYVLDGASLKFGPLGSTRRACPEPETSVETAFLTSLDKTRGWTITDGALHLLAGDTVLARFSTEAGHGIVADPGSMRYCLRSFPAGTVTLSGGEYRAPAAPGAASEIVIQLTNKQVFGTVQGQEAGAVVLVASLGGTGSFYELALLFRGTKGWENADTALLGDRVAVHAVDIEQEQIVVAMTTHGPGDPLCCPTTETKKRFAVQGNRLIPSADEAADVTSMLTGTVWQWVRTRYNNDTTAAPDKPENYTVRFLGDGSIGVKADCNLKGGTYSLEGQRLSITITHSTMAACAEGSQEEQFVRDLSAGGVCFINDGDLFIDLKYDTGTMRFFGKKEERP